MINSKTFKNSVSLFILVLFLLNATNIVATANVENTNAEDLKLASAIEAAKPALQTKQVTTVSPVSAAKIASPVKIECKNLNKDGDVAGPVSVYVNGKEVAKFYNNVGGYSAEARAKALVSRLDQFIKKNGNAVDILPGISNGIAIGRANDAILFSVDPTAAKEAGLTQPELALKWANNIRLALGAPKVVRDSSLIASRGNISTAFSRERIIQEQRGMASWYGGKFHGRRAADGSTFNKYNFTAAHRTLPLGSIVKVTNLSNDLSCIVKITDRGPFIPGRIIDLSKAAAKEIGMLSSGVAKVKVEVLKKD